MPQVTVLNILQTQPQDLAQWVATELLAVRLPEPGPNHTIDVGTDILPKFAIIANKVVFASELYAIVVGAKVGWSITKEAGTDPVNAKNAITTLNANIEMLHRAIQSLQTMYEAASRTMTGVNNTERISRQ